MLGAAPSVTVIAAIAVAACPTAKTWFAAEAIVGRTTWIVRLSLAFVAPPGPVTASCRWSTAETAVKPWYWSPETTSWSLPARSLVTSRTSVLPPSS